MKIGIVVYSKTGNTYFVANKIKEKLEMSGHMVSLEKLTESNEYQRGIEEYDFVIFGTPVHGFAPSPVMNAYIAKNKALQGLKIGVFVTESFPFKQMGGEQAIKQLKDICETKGGKVLETGIVIWSSIKRKKQIDDLAGRILKLVQF